MLLFFLFNFPRSIFIHIFQLKISQVLQPTDSLNSPISNADLSFEFPALAFRTVVEIGEMSDFYKSGFISCCRKIATLACLIIVTKHISP